MKSSSRITRRQDSWKITAKISNMMKQAFFPVLFFGLSPKMRLRRAGTRPTPHMISKHRIRSRDGRTLTIIKLKPNVCIDSISTFCKNNELFCEERITILHNLLHGPAWIWNNVYIRTGCELIISYIGCGNGTFEQA